MPTASRPSNLFIISLLGAMSVLTPFSIDMYLTAFEKVGADFAVRSAVISLTLSSYFIGLAIGQLFYVPMLDRFGRKRPVYFGLTLFIVASLGCGLAASIQWFIAFRFLQALGGCVSGVAAVTMVRDFFPREDCARILSRLFLFIAVSPLLAPTVGNLIIMATSWRAVFIALAIIAAAIVAMVYFLLPEGHQPDTSISLKPGPIFREYGAILRHPRFHTFAFAGAFTFAGLFTYVAGSPIIFMEGFHLSAAAYSGIFALLASGFIGGSQINVMLLRKYSSEWIFQRAQWMQLICGWVFIIGTAQHWYGLYEMLALFFVFLGCTGIANPNASAMALIPFTKNAGSASAMLGFIQLGLGAAISSFISLFMAHESFPIIAILGGTATIGFIIFTVGKKRALAYPIAE